MCGHIHNWITRAKTRKRVRLESLIFVTFGEREGCFNGFINLTAGSGYFVGCLERGVSELLTGSLKVFFKSTPIELDNNFLFRLSTVHHTHNMNANRVIWMIGGGFSISQSRTVDHWGWTCLRNQNRPKGSVYGWFEAKIDSTSELNAKWVPLNVAVCAFTFFWNFRLCNTHWVWVEIN